ncbi:T9SS type B sorting domain-containing protein [Kordia sp.]|uniref:T9SS type B sorting domain-containing protein n=1 Tax=Kordia sp. TaxID=1965332 RepID=UPI003D2C3BC0
MKRKILLFVFTIVSFLYSFSQGQTNIWYFGDNAGLDFNSGTPVAITDGQLETFEGCATISNADGQLLFYTDGITVWDKNHDIMPNGFGLQGNPSSSQSGIIVPFPDDTDKYYIFSVDQNTDGGGLFYSVLDLTLNAGNGDIIPSQKNILLLAASAEKIAAVSDENDGYWVVSYASFPGNIEFDYDTFHAYHITTAGININAVRSTYDGCATADGRGYLKISPDGTKIALCNQNQLHVCLHNFDSVTGMVSPEITQLITENAPYCAEFSPSSEKMYVSSGQYTVTTTYLHQFDLTATDINATKVQLHSAVERRAGLQLAIDGKIYYARPSQNYLGVINNPEADGTAADYVNEGVNLGSGISRQGLPPFIQSLFLVSITVENTCFGEATSFLPSVNIENITSILWDFGDGVTSTLENPTHTYMTTGTYEVTVTVNSGTYSQTNTTTVVISNPLITNTVSDYVVCDDILNDGVALFDLTTKDAEVSAGQAVGDAFTISYYTSFEDAETTENVLSTNYMNTSNPEEIFVKIAYTDNPNCFAITSFDLIVYESPTAEVISDIHICDELNDAQEFINLASFSNQVLGTQSSSLFDVFYYENITDATNDTNRLSTNYLLVNASQTIYARKQNRQNTACFTIVNFMLSLETQYIANAVSDLIICDDVSNDNTEVFDLAVQNEFVANGQTGGFSINYYTSQADADTRVNEIATSFANDTNPQEIFVRIENDIETDCYDTTSFFIEVKDVPNVNTNEITAYVCTNESIVISADAGYDEYNWNTGQTTQDITITEAGLYTVTVSTNYASTPAVSCSNTQTFRVIASDEAIITDIEIQDWTFNNNQLEVFVEGIGDYEYSIDGVNYQDSSIFNDLLAGSITVYVRDKNGCGVVSEEVNLLFYPSFFTPNNDGYNDYWQIISSEYELDLRIHIFDRYGKLLTILKPESTGWDGTFHGKQLPSSDYWFMVERPSNNQTYKGHFTLKR